MRLADPNVPVERIAEVLAGRFATTLSPAVVKRVLQDEGLERPPGGGRFLPAKPVEEEWLFAGAEFLRLADEELGYGSALTSVITTTACEAAAAAPPPSEPGVAKGRDGRGHWGLTGFTDELRRDLLELVEERHDRRSIIITSQFPVEKWHDLIGDPTLADAILDRIVHKAHKITMKGASMRKTRNNGPDGEGDPHE